MSRMSTIVKVVGASMIAKAVEGYVVPIIAPLISKTPLTPTPEEQIKLLGATFAVWLPVMYVTLDYLGVCDEPACLKRVEVRK